MMDKAKHAANSGTRLTRVILPSEGMFHYEQAEARHKGAPRGQDRDRLHTPPLRVSNATRHYATDARPMGIDRRASHVRSYGQRHVAPSALSPGIIGDTR